MDNRRKVRPVVHLLAYSELGGVNLTVARLVKELGMGGLPSIVLAPKHGPIGVYLRGLGVRWLPLDTTAIYARSRALSAISNLRLLWSLQRLNAKLVVVHCPYAYRAFRHALRAVKWRRLLHLHIEYDGETISGCTKVRPDCLVTVSRGVQRAALSAWDCSYTEDKLRVECIPYGVDTNVFCPGDKGRARRQLGLVDSNQLVVLLAANLAPHKGQETAIRAISILKMRGIIVQLWLAGVDRQDTGYEEKLRALAEQTGVSDQVRFLGFRSDMPLLMRAADIVLLPSTREGLGLCLLEAMASGCPVVASPACGVTEVVIDGETGLLVLADDIEGWAQRIAVILTDSDLRQKLVSRAYNMVVSNYTLERFLSRMKQLYAEMMDISSGSRWVS